MQIILVFDQDKNKKEPYEKRCAVVSFPNWKQRQFKGFSNDQDIEEADHMPDKFKIDAFLLLIDVSKDRTEKQPIEEQLELAKNILKSMKDIKKCPVVVALTKVILGNFKPNFGPQNKYHGSGYKVIFTILILFFSNGLDMIQIKT